MKKYNADLLFSNVLLKKNDTTESICTLYKCARCNYEILFSEGSFHRYELNRTTKYEDVFHDSADGKNNSFLEFECPKCKIKTRVYFGVYYGDKFPVINIESVLTE